MKFYLGTHRPVWLSTAGVPLMVSHRLLAGRRTLPIAVCSWALDSGGFSELALHGRWRVTEAEYLESVERYVVEVGLLDWAAPMDWMCEPSMLAKTGLSIQAHQERTVENFCRLRQTAPRLPIVPVLQGWVLADYERCVEMYAAAGVVLASEKRVGVGSVCRRQGTVEVARILERLAGVGALHGFGIKTAALRDSARCLSSADSMAWSLAARWEPTLPGHRHRSCANCLPWALRWRERVLAVADYRQTTLWEVGR